MVKEPTAGRTAALLIEYMSKRLLDVLEQDSIFRLPKCEGCGIELDQSRLVYCWSCGVQRGLEW